MRKDLDRDGVQRAAFPLAANILGRGFTANQSVSGRYTVVPGNREKTKIGPRLREILDAKTHAAKLPSLRKPTAQSASHSADT